MAHDDGPPEVVELVWRERGGPKVSQPARRGFGTTLIRNAFRDGDAGVDLRYDPDGVTCRIRVPLRPAIGTRLQTLTPWGSSEPRISPSDLKGLRILLAEDEVIVQMDLAAILEDAGAVIAGLASSVDAALSLAQDVRYDAALLDVNLHGRTIEPVAEAVLARGLPVVFTTGYRDLDLLPLRFRELPRVDKPISAARLISALQAELSGKDQSVTRDS